MKAKNEIVNSLRKSAKRQAANLLGNPVSFAITDFVVKAAMFPFIRVVGYHDTPALHAGRLRTHFEWYRRNFFDCDRARLDSFLNGEPWGERLPGLIISFDDGLRSNFSVAAPLLEEFGFTGWFMVPAAVPDLSPEQEEGFASEQLIPHAPPRAGEKLFVTWEDLRSLHSAGHQICCHSYHHKRLSAALSDEELDEEIGRSRRVFEERLGFAIDSFAWVGGEEYSFSRGAFDRMMREGYARVFSGNCLPILPKQSPFFLERNHADAAFSLNELRLSVGGLYDALYTAKRRRVTRLLTREAG